MIPTDERTREAAVELFAVCTACAQDSAEAACHRLNDLRMTPDGEPYCEDCWNDSPYRDGGEWTDAPKPDWATIIAKHFPAPAAATGEREEFETWARDVAKLDTSRNGDGYEYDEVWWAYQAWQARAALGRGVVSPPPGGGAGLTEEDKNFIERFAVVVEQVKCVPTHKLGMWLEDNGAQLLAIISRLTEKDAAQERNSNAS